MVEKPKYVVRKLDKEKIEVKGIRIGEWSMDTKFIAKKHAMSARNKTKVMTCNGCKGH